MKTSLTRYLHGEPPLIFSLQTPERVCTPYILISFSEQADTTHLLSPDRVTAAAASAVVSQCERWTGDPSGTTSRVIFPAPSKSPLHLSESKTSLEARREVGTEVAYFS